MFDPYDYETFLLRNAYSAAERAVYTNDFYGRGHSTKVGQHKSAAHTKARKAKRRMSKKH
jgi:hypothetical protein